jgi:hypothetical protein
MLPSITWIKPKIYENCKKKFQVLESKCNAFASIFFLIQMIWHKLLWEAKGRLEMPMKKI